MSKILIGDFHTHMNGNGINNRKSNVDFICKSALELNYNAVFLGCHDYSGSEFKAYVEDNYDLTAICGAEVTTTAGHILVYNIDLIPRDCWANNAHPVEAKYVITKFKDMGCKLVMAHPYKISKWILDIESFYNVVYSLDGAEIRNYKSFLRDRVDEFSHIREYEHLKLFSSSDCHPWEGDIMHKDYYTEIELDWFHK